MIREIVEIKYQTGSELSSCFAEIKWSETVKTLHVAGCDIDTGRTNVL